MAGDSDVFFERPLLSEGAKTRFLLFNKKDSTIEFNGEARFDKEFLVKDETSPTPQQIINYGEIEDCKFSYKEVSFPNTTNFSQIPYSACCFNFSVTQNDESIPMFGCHTDPGQCIVPGKRIMYKLRTKCKEA